VREGASASKQTHTLRSQHHRGPFGPHRQETELAERWADDALARELQGRVHQAVQVKVETHGARGEVAC
jgi:hypothetical protein